MLWVIMIHNRHTNDAYGHMNEHGIHYTKHVISVTYQANHTSMLPNISCNIGLKRPNIYGEWDPDGGSHWKCKGLRGIAHLRPHRPHTWACTYKIGRQNMCTAWIKHIHHGRANRYLTLGPIRWATCWAAWYPSGPNEFWIKQILVFSPSSISCDLMNRLDGN